MPRSRYGVALLAIVGLAVFSLAVLLYWPRPPRPNPLRSRVAPCKWDSELTRDQENTCEARCGQSPHNVGWRQSPIWPNEPGRRYPWYYCCPEGYQLCDAPPPDWHVCKSNTLLGCDE
jgi:hypothetical protein